MKASLLFALLSLTTHAFAGTYYECVEPGRQHITLFIDFQSADITVAQGNRVISAEKMTKVDPGFRQYGESLSLIRRASTKSGQVAIVKSGARLSGLYQGALSFGDRMDLTCVERVD